MGAIVATPCLLFSTLAAADLGLLWSAAAAATATVVCALGMLAVCREWWRAASRPTPCPSRRPPGS